MKPFPNSSLSSQSHLTSGAMASSPAGSCEVPRAPQLFPLYDHQMIGKKKVLNQWIDVFDCSSHVLKQNRITNIG